VEKRKTLVQNLKKNDVDCRASMHVFSTGKARSNKKFIGHESPLINKVLEPSAPASDVGQVHGYGDQTIGTCVLAWQRLAAIIHRR